MIRFLYSINEIMCFISHFLSFIPDYVEEIFPLQFPMLTSFHFSFFTYSRTQNLALPIHLYIPNTWYKTSRPVGTKHVLTVIIPLHYLALLSNSAYIWQLLLFQYFCL